MNYTSLMKEKLDSELFKHCLGTAKAAAELAKRYGVDPEKVYLAGIVHDYAKPMRGDELLRIADQLQIPLDRITRQQHKLLHAPLGAVLLEKELEICDPDILKAVACHTTGHSKMNDFEKVLYLADYIEENRQFPGVEKIRKAAEKDLELALLTAIDTAIQSIVARRLMLHPDSVAFRNSLLKN
ncbi:MAG: bis(5'-nucleosyl)-tetraphosphatase (symmetrical) YqeK [Bacillota bacterium]